MRRAIATLALALTGLMPSCGNPGPSPWDLAMHHGMPHCTTSTVRSIAGIYCQTLMPNPYLDSDV
jgi:hypothetical protein